MVYGEINIASASSIKGRYFISNLELSQQPRHTKTEVFILYVHITVCLGLKFAVKEIGETILLHGIIGEPKAHRHHSPIKKKETLQRKPVSHSSQFSYLAPYSTPGCPACH